MIIRSMMVVLVIVAALPCAAQSPTDYYRHSVFDNSSSPDAYWHSSAEAVAPSELENLRARLPVETRWFLSPPNALRLAWTSRAGGGWDAEIHVVDYRNRATEMEGGTLSFWVYSPQALAAADLPQMIISTAASGLQVAEFPASFTVAEPLGKYAGDLPADQWRQIRIPLGALKTASVYDFVPGRIKNIIFHQGRADAVAHTLVIDQIRVADEPATPAALLPAPVRLSAKAWERHVVLSWEATDTSGLAHYVIYRSTDGGPFLPVGIQPPGVHLHSDFVGRTGAKLAYRITAADWRNRESQASATVTAVTREFDDDELLTMLQENAFHYYWEGAEPNSGMAQENMPGDDRIVALGASGFGVEALLVGVERRFITRAQGLERVRRIVTFLERA